MPTPKNKYTLREGILKWAMSEGHEELVDILNKKDLPWPQDGDVCYSLSLHSNQYIGKFPWVNTLFNRELLRNNMIFQTEAEAETYRQDRSKAKEPSRKVTTKKSKNVSKKK